MEVTSVLHEGEWSASHSSRFILGKGFEQPLNRTLYQLLLLVPRAEMLKTLIYELTCPKDVTRSCVLTFASLLLTHKTRSSSEYSVKSTLQTLTNSESQETHELNLPHKEI
jgi:hypothetical protein